VDCNDYREADASEISEKLTSQKAKEVFNSLNQMHPIWTVHESDYEGDLVCLRPNIMVKSRDTDVIEPVRGGLSTDFNAAIMDFYSNLKGSLVFTIDPIVVVNPFTESREEYDYRYDGNKVISKNKEFALA